MIIFWNASGYVILEVCVSPTTITKKQEKIQKIPTNKILKKKKNVFHHVYAWYQTGWLSKERGWQSVHIFVKVMKTRYPNRQVVLIVNILASHINPQIVRNLYEKDGYWFVFPVKSSPILQPFYQPIFGNFKRILKSHLADFATNHNTNVNVSLDQIIMEVERKTFTINVIQSSFRKVDSFPI